MAAPKRRAKGADHRHPRPERVQGNSSRDPGWPIPARRPFARAGSRAIPRHQPHAGAQGTRPHPGDKGLLEAGVNRGLVVATLTVRQVLELYALREKLEGAAARFAAARIDAVHIENL